MYIKKLSVRGFRTYKVETVLNLSPGCSCIVGLNGAGKSNILLAVSFIMADLGAQSNERKIYLHEGASAAVTTAYVEVVLDNTDRRMSMFNDDEVAIKRIFSVAKDDWFLNGKHISKSEIFQLFESAGFSRSNPYFIVRQGKVAELTTMSDAARLRLLKDIAGTKVYDEKRLDSLRCLDETEERRHRVDENIQSMHKKLDNLQNEQKELYEYQEFDRLRRIVEFCLNELSWEDSHREEKESEATFKAAEEVFNRLDSELQGVVSAKDSLDIECQKIEENRRKLSRRRESLKAAMILNTRDTTRIALMMKGLKKESDEDAALESLQNELLAERSNTEEISARVNGRLRKDAEDISQKYEKSSKELQLLEQQRSHLYAKQSRKSRFRSIKERNDYLKKEIAERENLIESKRKDLQYIEQKLSEYVESRDKLIEEKKQLSSASSDYMLSLKKLEERNQSLLEQLDSFTEDRRMLQQKMMEIFKEKEGFSISLAELEEKFGKTLKFSNRRAAEATEKYIKGKELSKDKVIGFLIDNIKVREEYALAVEVASEAQLMNFIVSDAEVATGIVEFLRKNKGGSLTITPLSEISMFSSSHTPPAEKLLQLNKEEDLKFVKPLAECIGYEEPLKYVVDQVWGNTLLVKDAETAEKFVKQKWNCVTPDGDMFSSKGTMSGGYIKNSAIRLLLRQDIWKKKADLEAIEKKLKVHTTEFDVCEERLREIQEAIFLLNQERHDVCTEHEQRIGRTHEVESLLASLLERERGMKQRQTLVEADTANLKEEVEELKTEMKSSQFATLSSAELKILSSLQKNIRHTEEEVVELSEQVRKKKESLRNEQLVLDKNYKKIQELELKILNASKVEAEDKFAQLEREQLVMLKNKEEYEDDIKALEESLNEFHDSLNEKMSKVSTITMEEAKLQKAISTEAMKMQAAKQQIEIFRKQKEGASARRSSLPSIAPEFEKYKKLSQVELAREHTRIISRLSGFEHVNKKAIDQLSSFLEEQEALIKRKRDISESFNAILKLIEELDEAKDGTLLSTFQRVNQRFGEVFASLIPGGKAKLVLKKLTVEQQEERRKASPQAASSAQNTRTAKSSNYLIRGKKGVFTERNQLQIDPLVGISIKVSFNGADNGFASMHQLSGGQKTIVAVALIFAIQRCDPAPFYLFDEIDAALDDQYRSAVVEAIKKQAELGTQFIITTFRPQLLENADKFLRVKLVNRASIIDEVDKNAALEVIQETSETLNEDKAIAPLGELIEYN